MKRLATFGVTFVLLFIGVSSYALSDGGLELENWYERAVGIVKGSVESEKASELEQLAKRISQEEGKQLAEADEEVALLSSLISRNSNKEIQNYHLRYFSIAEETANELAKKNFNVLEDEQIEKVEAELENDIESILAEVLR